MTCSRGVPPGLCGLVIHHTHVLLQVVIHGVSSNWDSFNDDTLLEKAVGHTSRFGAPVSQSPNCSCLH